jgi:DNA-binding NarL/FixJ family response regulator
MKGKFLTGLELQLMEFVSQGLTQKDAADKMYRSKRTVDGYRDDIFQKLDCHNMAHAVAILFRQGILK